MIIEGLIIILVALVVLFSGMPLAFAFGVTGILCGLLFGASGPLDMMAHIMYGGVHSFELLTLPLFILMGIVLAHSPAGSDLYETLHRFLFRLPGGLAMSNVWACSIFAAMCGSSPATAAAIGSTGIPEMRKHGVSDTLATGCIVGGGTLGILIPPSITFIIYGIATETSIGKLFIAGVIPGILITFLFSLWVLIYSLYRRSKGERGKDADLQAPVRHGYTWTERIQHLPRVIPFVLLITLIMVSIYGGIATPSEAAAIGASASIVLVILFYRKTITLKSIVAIMQKTVNESAMIMLIAATTVFFQSVLTDLNVTQQIVQFIVTMESNRWLVMTLINLLLLLLGCFLPPFAIILLTAPMLHPLIVRLGFDPIWFGVIVTINMEAGCITPPFGINLYVVKGIAPDIPMAQILRGSLPFLTILLLGILIVSAFPQLALFLPQHMFGR